MMLPKHGKTLDVYLEPAESQNPETPRTNYQESEIPKLTFFNVLHPEWATGALRRTRHVKKVIDFGTPKDDDSHYALKVIYEEKEVRDIDVFRNIIRYVIENTGIHETHM